MLLGPPGFEILFTALCYVVKNWKTFYYLVGYGRFLKTFLKREKRLDQERELQVRQTQLLQDELDTRTKDLMTVRREKTAKQLELQADLAEKIEEVGKYY